MKIIGYFFMALLLLTVTAGNSAWAESKAPIKLYLESTYEGHTSIRVIAVVESIEVQDVIVNLGNTNTNVKPQKESKYLPKTLKLGQWHSIIALAPLPTILKIEVVTDQGSWLFTFN